MPNQEQNKQFEEIEQKISTALTVLSKTQFKLYEYPEILELIKQEALNRNLTPQNWVRWIIFKQLAHNKLLKTDIESYKGQEVDLTETKLKPIKLIGSKNGLLTYKKVFRTDFQRAYIK